MIQIRPKGLIQRAHGAFTEIVCNLQSGVKEVLVIVVHGLARKRRCKLRQRGHIRIWSFKAVGCGAASAITAAFSGVNTRQHTMLFVFSWDSQLVIRVNTRQHIILFVFSWENDGFQDIKVMRKCVD